MKAFAMVVFLVIALKVLVCEVPKCGKPIAFYGSKFCVWHSQCPVPK